MSQPDDFKPDDFMVSQARGARSKGKKKSRPVKAAASLPVINPHAVGIDIGSKEMYVCLPPDSCAEPIVRFDMFTEDIFAAANLIKKCGGIHVAMESTGVNWIQPFQIFETQGLKVTLVNPNYPKKKYKSDVEDCQWLQYLHSVGLLTPSFRPSEQVCAIRSILRHRDNHVRDSSSHIQRMQKALTEMNLLLHNVISDITGRTGLAIIDAIVAGERDPKKLAQFRDRRIRATEEEIAKSLVGDYRAEHLFTLKQSLEAFRFFQKQTEACDAEIARLLAEFDSKIDPQEHPIPKSTASTTPNRNGINLPGGDIRNEMYRINGVDLSQVPGVGATIAHALFCEIGNDLSKFQSAGHFASWLGLCPNNRISGGKVLFTKTRRVKSRAAQTLRTAAQSLSRSQSYLGDFYRKMRARFGPSAANTAAAHKLARIVFHILRTQESYDETTFEVTQERIKNKRIRNLTKQAALFGYNLTPVNAST